MTLPRLSVSDPARFQAEVVQPHRPAVLPGLVAHWPAVAHGRQGPAALAQYLAGLDSGRPVDAVMVPPDQHGRLFYSPDLGGFNFLRRQLPVSAVLEQLLRYAHFEQPPSVAVQSALLADCLPGFVAAHAQPVLPAEVAPRLWLGNHIVTPPHFDESRNLACVVAGRRRFTMFPPDCIGDLYIGPLGHAPTGTPISLVDLAHVDTQRFPRFQAARDRALVAELEPGDALYIPPLWWHHVESLDRFNLMVNYWWPAAGPEPGSALDALLHAVLALRPLPDEQRRAWAALFEHYVFGPGEAATAHLPPGRQGLLAPLDAPLAGQIRDFLRGKLGKP